MTTLDDIQAAADPSLEPPMRSDHPAWRRPPAPVGAVVVQSNFFAEARRETLMRVFPNYRVVVRCEALTGEGFDHIIMLWRPENEVERRWAKDLALRLNNPKRQHLDWLM